MFVQYAYNSFLNRWAEKQIIPVSLAVSNGLQKVDAGYMPTLGGIDSDTIGIKSNTQNRLLHKTSQGIPVSAPGPGRD